MNKSLSITTILTEPDLLINLVEKLAHRRSDTSIGITKMPRNLVPFDTSSIETYVNGTVALAGEGDTINMPFVTCFMFTCTKEKEGLYKIAWASSLS